MQRFFDRPDTRWSSLTGALHLYALPEPGSPCLETFASMSDALAGIGGLGRQQSEHMHMTLQRFDAHVDSVDEPPWKQAREQWRLAFGRMPPFTIRFAAPRARSHAVEAVGDAHRAWADLLQATHESLKSAGLDDVIADPPYGPHYSVAYCTADVDDGVVDGILYAHGTKVEFDVRSVSLVSVDQDPVAGTFGFTVIEEYGLLLSDA